LKDVDSRVFTKMLRKDGRVTISLCNFVGKGIIWNRNHIRGKEVFQLI